MFVSGEGLFIRAWRLSRQQSLEELAEKTGLSISLLDALETDDRHVELTIMETVARGLDIPAAWLHTDPAEFDLLFKDEEDENDEENRLVPWMADPVCITDNVVGTWGRQALTGGRNQSEESFETS